jgi:uncharacterized Zn finger protein
MYDDYSWRPYVNVATRRANARKQMQKLRKKGKDIQPIEIEGRKIATTFWGKGWCDHLESFSDYESRLPRGRTYARNGSVCHLEVQAGRIEAYVCGSSLYTVTIEIAPLADKTWDGIKQKCQGQIGSVLELLQGRLSAHVMEVVSDRTQGLFPKPGEIKLKCSCPDWATMCKHVAAVLYGIGNRLDHRPELLFVLRGADAEELISADVTLPTAGAVGGADAIAADGLADIFGIDLDMGDVHPKKAPSKKRPAKPKAKNPPAKAKTKSKAAPKKPKPAFDPKNPKGEDIARMRTRAGLTIAEFARQLGVSPQSMQRWESQAGALRLQARHLAAFVQFQRKPAKK